jgi:hypothetical protein
MRSFLSQIRWDWLTAFPWHPLFLALYAPLGLGAHNIGQIPLGFITRAVILSVILASILLFACRAFLRNWQVAGIVATILVILFLTYGHVYNFVSDFELGGFLIGRHRYLVLLWLGLAVLGSWWSLRRSRSSASLTPTFNLISVFLLAMPVLQLAFYEFRVADVQGTKVAEAQKGEVLYDVARPNDAPLRDVYYIILDAYGRSDTLLNTFGYDNSAFLGKLEDMGFYVVECAQSNYSKTDLSLSSSLNMQYVTALDSNLTPENTDRVPLWNLLRENQVKKLFDELGYRTITFETGFHFTHLNNVDVLYSPERKGFNEFEILYVRTTLARLLDDAGLLAHFQYTPEDRKRELILFDLEKLQEIPLLPGPKFVFAHLVIPHQPFVFGPDGEPLVIPERLLKGRTYYTVRDYQTGYTNQVAFISDRIAQVLQSILANSSVPPVIIIQGDHGPSHTDVTARMAILNAYYFPGKESTLYPEITPVNSFRLLSNNYFNTDFELLDDVSYYSEYPYAYQFEVIPNSCQSGSR